MPEHRDPLRAEPARVAVTGAGGFVGAAAVRRLVAGGARVLAFVRPGGDRARLAKVPAAALSVLELDLGSVPGAGAAELEGALQSFAPDALLHAGWIGVRGEARRDPAQTGNVASAVEIVRAAAAAGVRRVVGLGTQAEYGPWTGAVREEDCPRPVTLYGAAKLAAGHLFLAVAERFGMSAAWIRAFSFYGPGERRGALIPDLVHALASGTPFPLSTCEQRWDYLYEDDAAEALALALADADARGFFNLASGTSRPLREVVRLIRDLAAPGASLLLGHVPGEHPGLEADVSRIRRALGWEPVVPLEEGIHRTVQALVGDERRTYGPQRSEEPRS